MTKQDVIRRASRSQQVMEDAERFADEIVVMRREIVSAFERNDKESFDEALAVLIDYTSKLVGEGSALQMIVDEIEKMPFGQHAVNKAIERIGRG